MKKLIHALNEFQKLTLMIYKNNWRYVWSIVIMCMIVFVFDALFPSIVIEKIFDALSLGNTQYLVRICLQILLVFGCVLTVAILFFIYSNAWFLLISNRSCCKLFQEFFKMPHAEVCNHFSDGEIYNRLIMGAAHTISVFAASTQFFSTAASSVILLFLLAKKLYWLLWLAVVYFIFIAIRTAIETNRNANYQMNIQQSASMQTHQTHVLLENLEQAQMCGMTGFLDGQLMEYRKSYWGWKNKKDKTKALLDFITAVAFGGFQVAAFATIQIIQPAIAAITSVMTMLNRYSENLMMACENAADLPSYFVPINRLIEFLQKYSIFGEKVKTPKKDGLVPYLLSFSNVNLFLNESHILKNINFTIKRNEKVALIGQNGSGKSTVIKAIMGQFYLSSGEISICAENKKCFSSYIPVTPQLFSVSSLNNIAMGTTLPENEYRSAIKLDFLGQTATELSGGQQQQVNIYRAVVGNRELLIADEPTSALNPELKEAYMDFIVQSSSTLLVVTHDPELLSRFDRIIMMNHGTIIESGDYLKIVQTDAYLQWIGSLNPKEV